MDLKRIRNDFPALKEQPDKRTIIYVDNTSVTLTPQPVINAMNEYYNSPGNLRSAHEFSVKTMIKCEDSRKAVSKFINAQSPNEIIWTKNATEGINLISRTLELKSGDIVLTTEKEHNSNIVPWQNLLDQGIIHNVVKSKDDLTFELDEFEKCMNENVKIVSMNQTSIVDGYSIPAKEIIKIAHEYGALVLLDAVLTVPRQKVDVQDLDVDFLVFSLSNMCGPNGLGVLYGKEALLKNLRPLFGGGGTNMSTTFEGSEYQAPPRKFEAGNLNCAIIIGAGAAIEYLNGIGIENISKHEIELNKMLTNELSGLDELLLLGPREPELRGGMFNFNVKGINPHDIGISLEELGNILLRSGILCAQPWFNEYFKDGAVSILFYLYNTQEEVEIIAQTIKQLIRDFA